MASNRVRLRGRLSVFLILLALSACEKERPASGPPVPRIVSTEQRGGEALLTVTVTERGGGTGLAALYRRDESGSEIFAGLAAARIENGAAVWRPGVPLTPGDNHIGVAVFDRSNTAESEIVWTVIRADPALSAAPAKPILSAFPEVDFPFVNRAVSAAGRTERTTTGSRPAAQPNYNGGLAVSSAGFSALRGIRSGFGVNFAELNPASYRKFDPDALGAMGMERYEIAYLAGRDAFRNGDYDRAIAEYGASIGMNGAFAPAYAARGVAWAGKKELDRAIEDYGRALRIDGAYAEVYNYRGFAWADKGEFSRAAEDYGRALRYRENYADAWYNRACAWSDMGDYDRAITDFTRVIELESRNAAAYNRRGGAWYGKGDTARAIGDFNEAIRLAGNNAVYYYNRGNAWYAEGDYEKALTDLNQALGLDGRFAAAYRSRARIWRMKGDEAKAASDIAVADRIRN